MDNKTNMLLGEKLKELRTKYKMTQDEIAALLDMSRTSFSKYENGASSPPLSVMRKLAAIYNVRLEYLIYDSVDTIELHDEKNAEEPKNIDGISSFSDLTDEEKFIVMKMRLMNAEQKSDIIEALENDNDNN